MPSDGRRRQPPGQPAARRSSEPRTNLDPGAYIGRKPERGSETVPGGLGHSDRRDGPVAARPGDESTSSSERERHREGGPMDDETVGKAGDTR